LLLRRTFDIDILDCAKCHFRLRVVATIAVAPQAGLYRSPAGRFAAPLTPDVDRIPARRLYFGLPSVTMTSSAPRVPLSSANSRQSTRMTRFAFATILLATSVVQACSDDTTVSQTLKASCANSPSAPAEFLTSNQVMPPGGPAADVPAQAVGVLRSFLERSPGVVRKLVAAQNEGSPTTLEVFVIPAGTPLYKGLGIPASGLTPQDDVLNQFATSTNWYSSREVAQSYADSSWGKQNGFKVVRFQAIRRLTLLNLASTANLGYLWSALQDELKGLQDKLASVSGTMPADASARTLLQGQIDDTIRDRKILELTTGVKATYAEQLAWLLELGATPTYNSDWPQYSPQGEIDKRGTKPTDAFGIESSGNVDSWKSVTLMTGCEAEPETVVRWGAGAEDLNRISFSTALDKELTRIIARKLNVDGYFSPPAPSLFHASGRLVEEVGVFDPGSSTSIVEVLDTAQAP
jgi:hypothetical protein